MLRALLGTFAVCFLTSACVVSADETKNNAKESKENAKESKATKATITKVDAKKGTITVKMKDKDGKEAEHTFKLTEDVRYFDSTGKAVEINLFRSGDYVLVVEREGMLKELRQPKDEKKPAIKK